MGDVISSRRSRGIPGTRCNTSSASARFHCGDCRLAASRACARNSPLLIGSSPASAPRAAAIGSSGAGLSTTRSPRSSSASVEVPHRRRMLDGIEICPQRDILSDVMIMKRSEMIHESEVLPARPAGPRLGVSREVASAQSLFKRVQLALQLVRQTVEFREMLAELRQLGLPLLRVDPQQLRHIPVGHL